MNLARFTTALMLGVASATLAAPDRDSYEGMRAFSIRCLGGKGYALRHAAKQDSTGVLGAFLDPNESAVSIEIQRRFVGIGGGVDNEFTELIGVTLPDVSSLKPDGKVSLTPKVGKVAYADSSGRAKDWGTVNAGRSKLNLVKLHDGGVLISGSIALEHPEHGASVVKVACVAPL